MSIEEQIYTRLSTDVDVVAIASTRIYPNQKPQNSALPAVTFRRVSALRPSAMNIDTGIVQARFQFDIWTDEKSGAYDTALALRTAVQGSLQRWRATTPIRIWDVFILGEVDLFEDEVEQQHLVLDVEVNYTE